MAIRVSVDDGDRRAEAEAGWTATAWVTGWDPPAAVVDVHHERDGSGRFDAYLLLPLWRCHALGRSGLPPPAVRVARRALKALPSVPT